MKRSAFCGALGALSIAGMESRVAASSQSMDDMMEGRTAKRTVAVLLGDYSVLLDWAGPAETFYSAGFNASSQVDEFRVVTVGKNFAPIHIQVLGAYQPQYSVNNAPRPDVIVVPGSMPSDLASDVATVAWVKKALGNGCILLSVCTGAIVLAGMNLLAGLNVTTSHGALKMLARMSPTSKIERGVRFVDSGQIVTAAGTITGVDAALHIVTRLIGERRAADEREYLEYEWTAS
jgi:transcriptional regulator GlxA family with amidase domain